MYVAMPTIEFSLNASFLVRCCYQRYSWGKLSQPCILYGLNMRSSASEAVEAHLLATPALHPTCQSNSWCVRLGFNDFTRVNY